MSTTILKIFLDTEPSIYFSIEGQVVPLALPNLVESLFSDVVLQTELVPGTANASKYRLEIVLRKVIISI